MERGDFRSAWGGIPSVCCPLFDGTEASRRGFSLVDIVRGWRKALATGWFGERKGRLAAGFDADMWCRSTSGMGGQRAELHYRHAISPYLGERLTGKV